MKPRHDLPAQTNSFQNIEMGGWKQVQGQSGLYSVFKTSQDYTERAYLKRSEIKMKEIIKQNPFPLF